MKAPIENADVLDEVPFRVSVNLERFFSDERARCYVSVSSRRRVRWLQRRLRRLFELPRRVSLLLREHLLPPDEPLALLRPDDTVHVIPSEIDWTGTKRPIIQTLDTSITDEEDKAQSTKKKKSVQSIQNKMDIRNNDCTKLCDVIPFKVTENSEMNMEDTAAQEILIPFNVTDSVMNMEDTAAQEMLMEVKNRALSLLENYETEQSPNRTQELPMRRTRRRVRRRRVRPLPEVAPVSCETQRSVTPDQPSPTPPPATSIPASQDENDSMPMTKQVCDSVKELRPPSQFFFCGVDMTVPVVVRNNSVTPREARIVHPLS